MRPSCHFDRINNDDGCDCSCKRAIMLWTHPILLVTELKLSCILLCCTDVFLLPGFSSGDTTQWTVLLSAALTLRTGGTQWQRPPIQLFITTVIHCTHDHSLHLWLCALAWICVPFVWMPWSEHMNMQECMRRWIIVFSAEAEAASPCLAALPVCVCLSLVSVFLSLCFRWANPDNSKVK